MEEIKEVHDEWKRCVDSSKVKSLLPYTIHPMDHTPAGPWGVLMRVSRNMKTIGPLRRCDTQYYTPQVYLFHPQSNVFRRD